MPKPPVCECEADAIILSAWIIISILILVFLMVLMLFMYYSKKKPIEFVPILIVFLFSIILGIGSFSIQFPLTPYFQIFFVLFQTVFFVLTALEHYNNKGGW